MSVRDIDNWLTTQIRHYIPVKDEDAVHIFAPFSCRKLAKGEFLLKEGQYGDWWGFVYQGLLRSFSYDRDGVEYTNTFFREGSFTCELISFSGVAVSQTNMVALEDAEILCVNKATLDELFRNYPDFERFGRLLYEKVLISYKQDNLFRVRLTAQERYLHFLKNEPELIKRVPLKYIASFLNVTDTSLSRIRRRTRHLAG